MTAAQLERLQDHLVRLRLFKSRERLEALLQEATAKELAYADFLDVVLTEEVTAKINTDSNQWGDTAAKWLINELGGKGKILVLNGPAGVSVSEDRRKGATAALCPQGWCTPWPSMNSACGTMMAHGLRTSAIASRPIVEPAASETAPAIATVRCKPSRGSRRRQTTVPTM